MKRIKYFVILLIMFLANITLVFAKDDVINKIDINITLDNSGNAHVEEIWDVKANMGTEFYKGMYNLGNMKVTNFKVYENNTLFTYVDKWNINASLDEKKNKNGINYTDEGTELCFGKGSMGRHVFKLTYDISNFVFKTNDSLVIYYQIINMNMTPPPKNFSLVLTGPNAFDKDIDVWGYGYKGYAYVNNGKIYMSNEEKTLLEEGDYAVLLVKFPLGMFNVDENNRYDIFDDFDEVYNKAEDGTFDYDYSEKEDILGIIITLGTLIFTFAIVAIAIASANEYKFESLGRKIKIKEINNFRDIPCDQDIFNAYFLTIVYGLNKKNTSFFGAVLLKWLLEDKIEMKEGKKKNSKDIYLKHDLTFENNLEQRLYTYLISASKDYILEKKELEKWSRNNYNKLFDFLKDSEKYGRANYINKGLVEKKTSKFLIKDGLKEEAIKLAGLKKFLNEFSRIKERQVIEVKLWKEYLIFAQIFGIAKEVANQFKDYYPDIVNYNDGNSNLDIMDVIILNNLSTNVVNAASSARSAANNYNAGGGGFSSGGGGFSSFGGGGGGGR